MCTFWSLVLQSHVCLYFTLIYIVPYVGGYQRHTGRKMWPARFPSHYHWTSHRWSNMFFFAQSSRLRTLNLYSVVDNSSLLIHICYKMYTPFIIITNTKVRGEANQFQKPKGCFDRRTNPIAKLTYLFLASHTCNWEVWSSYVLIRLVKFKIWAETK